MAIEIAGLSFTYPDGTAALSGLGLEVKKGEFLALLASNGSGKTTLIKVIVGLLSPQEGVVKICGQDILQLTEQQLYQRVGLVMQNPKDQLFGATVEEDVAFGPRNLGLSAAEVEARVQQSLTDIDALHLRRRAIHHLSFGEQKRVAIAGALAMQPEILVLDEPTAGLDPGGEDRMMHFLSDLNRKEGLTVVLATHSVDLLPLFADRICMLRQGRVIAHGAPAEVFGDQELLAQSNLRLPYISDLLYRLKSHDGVPIGDLPLTVRQARSQLLELIPAEILLQVSAAKAPAKEE